jgi:hypothetical protein
VKKRIETEEEKILASTMRNALFQQKAVEEKKKPEVYVFERDETNLAERMRKALFPDGNEILPIKLEVKKK